MNARHGGIAVPNAGQQQRFAMLAVGCQAGLVWLWRFHLPCQYSPSGSASAEAFSLVRAVPLHASSLPPFGILWTHPC